MSRTCYKTILGILLTASCFASSAISQVKRGEPQATGPCPDQKEWTGRYRNYVYGFSIVIPAGLKGYWNSAACVPEGKTDCVCMGDHGRFIPLSDEAHIEVFVGYQMESDWTVVDQEVEEISGLKKDQSKTQVKVISSRWLRLGTLNARRFVAQFVEGNKNIIKEHIIAFYQGVEYELILRTTAGRYRADRRQFLRVIATWKMTPRV
jgi:hypothetical protein